MQKSSFENKKLSQGITLIEVLLVIAIISLLGVSVASVGRRFLVNNYLENKTNELISFLQTAQINAISGKEGSAWGVNVTANQIILFKGDSYATRDASFDLFTSLPNSVNISNQEIVFNKVNGNPTNNTSYTITNGVGQSNVIGINQLGVIDVN